MRNLLIYFFISFCFITKCFAFDNEVKVLYTIDRNYSIFTLISIDSILRNNTSHSKYWFYIAKQNLSLKQENFMRKFIEKRGANVSFIDINNDLINSDKIIYNSPNCNYITSVAMARIFAADLLPKNINKIIYLDADTYVLSDLKDLYNYDIDNNFVGLVLNKPEVLYPKTFYDFKNGYFNSGVMLINLEKWRSEKVSKGIIKYYQDNIRKFTFDSNTKNCFYLVDQDLINLYFDGKIKKIPSLWNQQITQIYNIGVIHYIGSDKPWKFNSKNNKTRSYLNNWGKITELKLYRHYYLIKYYFDFYSNKINHLTAKIKSLL